MESIFKFFFRKLMKTTKANNFYEKTLNKSILIGSQNSLFLFVSTSTLNEIFVLIEIVLNIISFI